MKTEGSLYTSVDVHADSDTPLIIRRSRIPLLCLGTSAKRVTIYLWGNSAKRLLKVLQEAKVEEWVEVEL